jgi:hypothetical protein
MLLASWLLQLLLTARTASGVLSSSGRRPRRRATGEPDRSATLFDSPGPASDQGEPFGEPTWTGLRLQAATPSHRLGWSSAQWALRGDAQRCLENDWGSRGRRFKSGRPDWVNEFFRIYLWLTKSQWKSQSRCERPRKGMHPIMGPDVLPGHLPIRQSQRRRPVKWSKIARPFPRSRDLAPADEADRNPPRRRRHHR